MDEVFRAKKNRLCANGWMKFGALDNGNNFYKHVKRPQNMKCPPKFTDWINIVNKFVLFSKMS